MTHDLTYASLFSAAGLGCYGFKMAEYECVATAELLPRRLEVQKANDKCSDPNAYYLGNLSDRDFLSKIAADVATRTKDLTFVIATPPCQGMSVANHKKGDELNRNSLVVNSLLFIEETRPRFFVLENVRAFLTSTCSDTDSTLRPIGEAIDLHLGGSYNILKRVVNLKNYGAPSSRTRTLVVGVRNDIHDVTPTDLFPEYREATTLRALIGDLPRLTEMGEIDDSDIYHSFRPYNERMRPWIHDLVPGQSAFDNTDPSLRPHRIIDGKCVENKNGNGDKYKRNEWDKVAPCVHTRNDILASQATVHPEDDRVFSVRELSRMMGVPDQFKWTDFDLETLNNLPLPEKQQYIKQNDTNIRQCLGEGVPTSVIQEIALNAKKLFQQELVSDTARYVYENEAANPRKKELSAFYTRQDTVFSLLSLIPLKKKKLRILEPSVGCGAFLPEIFARFHNSQLDCDVIDIDPDALDKAGSLVSQIQPKNVSNFKTLNLDFLEYQPSKKYDLIVGNPPFGSSGKISGEFRLKDLFAKFLARSLDLSEYVALVIPKTFLNGSEYAPLRKHLANECDLIAVEDYGETAFADIKIETIGIVLRKRRQSTSKHSTELQQTIVRSQLFNSYETVEQNRVTDPKFPSWLLYRTKFFDATAAQLTLGAFKAFRDRSLTKSKLGPEGDFPILKARGISSNGANLSGDYCNKESVSKSFWRSTKDKRCLAVPNLSYYPRACVLPANVYVDGSAAVLIPTTELDVEKAIQLFSSTDFFYFYRIARNFSVRSLNIDAISSFYWGVPKKKFISQLPLGTPEPSSKQLFVRI
ncbi:DNA cytosine methyltransferase [Corynebacterium phoceense]|uniref:DNA cytosine methyltransferase n=1 Tax=Corynebacterium phoceense TaxID=1686286 RepID=UPI001DCEB7AD|nr:DNA cytosine methyltransferase [Corynebacterium phoceense]HJG44201.1 DNA cytosine methyltransferase [Corynebacterium phoceense]